MMRNKRQMGYITSSDAIISKPKSRIFSVLICFFLAFGFIGGIVGDAFLATQHSVVHADPEDDKETMEGAVGDTSKDQKGFEGLLQDATKEPKKDTFAYVIKRLISVQYMNDTEKGVAAGDLPDKKRQCDVNSKGAGTAIYHNCDVPNIMAEFMQTITALLIPTGPQNAEAGQAKVGFGFGLPSTIPGNGTVPIKPNERTVKYTALELFGYNLKYTNYRGEWDNIKVMTEARALSNFGVMDSLRLGVATVVNGIVSGVSEGTSRFLDGLSRGDILGAIGGFFSGLFEGGSSAAVNTVLDTSDMNVFNTYAWYRVDYGSTLYRARELNQTEIAAIIQAKFAELLTKEKLSKADLPKDFKAIEAGPPKPKEAISKCVAHKRDADGKVLSDHEIKDPSNPPGGINEGDCKEKAKSQYSDDNPTYSVDGTQKKELIKDWKVTNASTFSTGTQYNINCEISDSEDNRTNNLARFYECWTAAWTSQQSEVKKDEQHKVNQEWLNKTLGQEMMVAFFSHPANNFNAPWNRFVCTDANGKDLKNGDKPVMLFNFDGSYNQACVKVRPPIQNGYYGNGYLPDEKSPGLDTRWAALEGYSIFDIFVAAPSVWGDSSSVGNAGLNVAKFFTQASNAVIDLAFAPILEKLGLDTKIVSILEAFRDSLYFPFVSFMIAIAGFYILYRAGKSRQYAAAWKDLALVIGTFMVSVIILFNPQGLLKVVDQLPSEVETAIIGTIFNVGLDTDDGVCSAAQTAGGGGGTDLSGNALNFSPRASIRTMECEIWRTFTFNPWVLGQWGTSYDNLYANGNAIAGGKALKNTNGSLVGDAPVVMGGGKTIHNWALYQLEVTNVGTSTTEDVLEKTGSTPRDFYRIVDVQAGPNNGEGTDSRYYQSWSGKNSGPRNVIGVMAGFVGIIGFITILAYSIVKIEITLLTAFMLLFIPFFLLLGLHPTMGRLKLKQYTGTIIALMIQRIVLVTLLAVMLKILTAISLATQNYMIGGLLAAGVCLAFLSYRKQIFGIINSSVSSKTGGLFAENNLDNTFGKMQEMLPLSVRNRVGIAKTTVSAGAGGFVGGYLSGGIGTGLKHAKETAKVRTAVTRNQQRRTGVGAFTKFSEAQAAGEAVAEKQLQVRDEKTGTMREEAVIKKLNATFTNRRDEDLRKAHAKSEAGKAGEEYKSDGEWMNIDPKSRINREDVARLVPLYSRISQLEKLQKDGTDVEAKKPKDPTDVQALAAEAKHRRAIRVRRDVEIAELKKEAKVIEDRLYSRNADHIEYDYFQEARNAKKVEDDDERKVREERNENINASRVTRLAHDTARMKRDFEAKKKEAVNRVQKTVESVVQSHEDKHQKIHDLNSKGPYGSNSESSTTSETTTRTDKTYRQVKREDNS